MAVAKSTTTSSATVTATAAAPLSGQAMLYMILLAFQFGMQPNLTRKFAPPTICQSTFILSQEIVKLFLAWFMLTMSGNLNEALSGWSVESWISVAVVPAALYVIQNLATLLAYQNLDAMTFNVLNQTKTLSAALCCYFIMGRRQSQTQIFALLLLLMSALIIEKILDLDFILQYLFSFFFLDNNNSNNSNNQMHHQSTSSSSSSESMISASRHITHGVIPVLLASFLSGLAGAWSQKNLQSSNKNKNTTKNKNTKKNNTGRNSYLFSMELCVASILILLLRLLFSDDGIQIKENGFFAHWTPYTFIPILTNAMGGIIVGLVTKYAGSVRKGFALIFGILISGLIQAVHNEGNDDDGNWRMNHLGISKEQIIGGLLAGYSLWLHSTNPYISSKTTASTATKTTATTTTSSNDSLVDDKQRKKND